MTKFVKCVLLLTVLAVAVGAFAAEKSITFSSPTNLNGQKIEPGDYKLKYDINGTTANVEILKNKKTVASATGQVIDATQKADRNRVVNSKNGDGTYSLVELQFAKDKTAIRFSPETASGK
ncbi:MAG TPA: hypothetical protein VN577_13610 [Terriglobales bacterium]|nr:hypothetical protein [Terriglobales bacterium]